MIDVRLNDIINTIILQTQNLRNDINSLNGSLANFSSGVELFREDIHTIREIHRELLNVLRSMSFVQSEVPTLLNGIVGMTTEIMTLNQQIRDDLDVKISNLDVVVVNVNKYLTALTRLSIAVVSGEKQEKKPSGDKDG